MESSNFNGDCAELQLGHTLRLQSTCKIKGKILSYSYQTSAIIGVEKLGIQHIKKMEVADMHMLEMDVAEMRMLEMGV